MEILLCDPSRGCESRDPSYVKKVVGISDSWRRGREETAEAVEVSSGRVEVVRTVRDDDGGAAAAPSGGLAPAVVVAAPPTIEVRVGGSGDFSPLT
jgi:hypothetical protein